MKSKHMFIVGFVALVISISACNKDDCIIENVNVPEFYIENNIIFFKNHQAFKNTMTLLHKGGRGNLSAWEEEVGVTNSYRMVLDSLLGVENENVMIEDPYFATIVNQEGLYVINDTIHKITFENEYLIPSLDFSKLNFLEGKGTEYENLTGISVHKIERKDMDIDAKNFIGWQTLKKVHPDTPTLSAHLKCWCVNYFAYGSIGVRIKGRKNDGGWRDDRMVYAAVDGSAYGGAVGFPPVWYPGSSSGYNKYNVDKTLFWYIGGLVYCEQIICTYSYQDGGYPTIYEWTISFG